VGKKEKNAMGALTIAFDTIIVGVLALPWVVLLIHLFCCEGENRLGDVLDWVKKQEQPAAVGVLLFAMTYTLGSAVSRVAQDFFNDGDLRLQIGWLLFHESVTEDRILTRVYCDRDDNHLLIAGSGNPALAEKISDFQGKKSLCSLPLAGFTFYKYEKKDDDFIAIVADIFGLQENALMDKGGDYTVRLRQLHDQVMVLRGAAFNGVIGFSLCLFAFGAALRREKPGSWLGLTLVPVPALVFGVALKATFNHFAEHLPSDPPYMEFTLLLLALAGGWLVWRRPSPQTPDQARAKEAGTGRNTGTKCDWQKEHWAGLVVLSAILAVAAVLGWWSTEVLYGEQVIYSYDTQGTIAAQK
jgi:hypothetical protein